MQCDKPKHGQSTCIPQATTQEVSAVAGQGKKANEEGLRGVLPLRVVAGSLMIPKVMGHLKESGKSGESSKCSGTNRGGGQCTSLCRWASL